MSFVSARWKKVAGICVVMASLCAPATAENKLAEAAQPDAAAPSPAVPLTPPKSPSPSDDTMTMSDFLDRLMIAESGGDDAAKNPRSTAVGPYQFIESTWLDLMRRHFTAETEKLTPPQFLALRQNRAIARRAAEIYSKENAAILTGHGAKPTFTHLRLAFLLGPMGAVRVIKAEPDARVAVLLGPTVARANPFMYGLTAEGLVARAARDLKMRPSSLAALAASEIPPEGQSGRKGARGPRVAVRCNLSLPSCRRWLTLATARAPSAKKSAKRAAAL